MALGEGSDLLGFVERIAEAVEESATELRRIADHLTKKALSVEPGSSTKPQGYYGQKPQQESSHAEASTRRPKQSARS